MALTTRKKTSAAKTKKKVTTKTKKKTAPVKAKKGATKIRKGSKYSCTLCGVAVTIDEVCGCVDMCDIICCGEQMKPKKK